MQSNNLKTHTYTHTKKTLRTNPFQQASFLMGNMGYTTSLEHFWVDLWSPSKNQALGTQKVTMAVGDKNRALTTSQHSKMVRSPNSHFLGPGCHSHLKWL